MLDNEKREEKRGREGPRKWEESCERERIGEVRRKEKRREDEIRREKRREEKER